MQSTHEDSWNAHPRTPVVPQTSRTNQHGTQVRTCCMQHAMAGCMLVICLSAQSTVLSPLWLPATMFMPAANMLLPHV